MSAPKAALAVAFVAIAFASGAHPLIHAVYDTVDRAPTALALLRRHADSARDVDGALPGGARPLVIVLIDGLRLDESRRLPSLAALEREGARGVVELPLPTLSRPFYHALLTGVPPSGSGVRRNAEGQRAVLDSLANRARAAGGRVAFVAEGLDWMAVMHGAPSDVDDHGDDALGRPLDEVLRRFRGGDLRGGNATATEAEAPPLLTLVHTLAVDSTAHDDGIDGDAHRRALAEADAVLARVVATVDLEHATIVVVSDHGHIANGGHGGDEPAVRRVPFVMAGVGALRSEATRPLAVEELAPTLARAMNLPAPRSAVAGPTDAFGGAPTPPLSRSALLRRELLARATAHDDAQRRVGHVYWLALAALAALMGLGAIKRAFSGFDLGTLVAPAIAIALVHGAHVFIVHRPYTMSALDDAVRQGTRLFVTGLVAALVGIAVGALLARARAREPARERTLVPHLRRAAGALAWVALSIVALVLAWLDGGLGPWPLSAFAYYAPILAVATGAGACAGVALVMLGTIVSRRMEITPTSC